jgi:HEPN domain-containing protein
MKEVIEEWLNKVESDLEVCRELLNRKRFADIVAFHAQQASEKYLKALWEFFDTNVVKARERCSLKCFGG